VATDHLTNSSLEISARCVVAAAGVWLDTLRPKADAGVTPLTRPAKGVHLVFPESRIGNRDVALTLQTTRDHRITFVIPWMGRTLVGTTDDDYAGELDQPRASHEDTEYLMEAVMKAFPGQRLSSDDIISVQAGLRPLVNDQNDTSAGVSREDRVVESDSGLISIAGGKLTTYRRMAKKVVDLVAKRLVEQRIPSGACRTGSIPIGASTAGPMPLLARQPADIQAHLVHLYGGYAENVCALAEGRPALLKQLAPDLPHIAAQIVFAVRDEMAVSLGDALIRRVRFTPTDRALGLGAVNDAADLLTQELGWSSEERESQIKRYRNEILQFTVPGRIMPEIPSHA
jgi:glycerol-3-phosphate dehydrogenase